jgi:hypothetical protein
MKILISMTVSLFFSLKLIPNQMPTPNIFLHFFDVVAEPFSSPHPMSCEKAVHKN